MFDFHPLFFTPNPIGLDWLPGFLLILLLTATTRGRFNHGLN